MSKEFLDSSISEFINPRLVVAASNLTVADAAKVMLESRVNSILVFENDQVVGIVTNKDFLNNIVAKGLDPSKITIKEITKQPLVTIGKEAKVGEAIDLMKEHDIRRLIVKDHERVIGTISQKKIIGDLRDHAIIIPELDQPHKIKCPYCSSEFENRDSLSSHIDDVHVGKGLFEGNLSQTNELGSVKPGDYPKSL